MLKVGDFSKLAHVTVKTLRHYDQIGLLKPVWIDRFSGYRFYTLSQLPRLNRILALKDLGFSLAEIGGMLDKELPASKLREIFNQKQMELEQHVVEEQARLQRVAERLQEIERLGRLPVHEVTLKAVPELTVATLRGVVSNLEAVDQHCGRMRAELNHWALSAGLQPRGPWLTLFHNPEYRERQLDVEVALVVPESKNLPTGAWHPAIQLRHLPEVQHMACLLQPGGPSAASYTALFTWAERSGYYPNGPARELLLDDPTQKQSAYQFVEVQLPVESTIALKQKMMTDPYRKEEDMEPKFVDLPAFDVVGMRYYGKNEHQEISGLWGEFNKRCGEIKHVKPNSAAYGVCIMVPEAPAGEFEYVASFAVDATEGVPEGMVTRHVSAHKYAVFTHVGALNKLRDTYNYVYQVWAPQSGFELAGDIDFEYYDEDFKDFAPDSKFYIYVPVK